MAEDVHVPMHARPDRTPPLDHAGHDPLLVARLAAGDLEPERRPDVEAWVARCAACADLLADLGGLQAALRHDLPVPRRSRDFRLSPELAGAAPPRSMADRIAALLGWRGLQPLAGVVAVLGLLLVVNGLGAGLPAALQPIAGPIAVPAMGDRSATGAPSNEYGAFVAPSAAASPKSQGGQPLGPVPIPTASPPPSGASVPAQPSAAPAANGATIDTATGGLDRDAWLVGGGSLLIVAGALGWLAARRLGRHT